MLWHFYHENPKPVIVFQALTVGLLLAEVSGVHYSACSAVLLK
jgi:hypothetical protein